MASTPSEFDYIYVARKDKKGARIERVKAATYKPRKNKKPMSFDDPRLTTLLTEAFVNAVADAKRENAKFARRSR